MGGMAGEAGRGLKGRDWSQARALVAVPGHAAACMGLAWVAAAFAWKAPAAHGLAAAALVCALALDAGGRLAVARAERRTGIAARLSGLPSLALPLGGALGLGLLAATLLGFPGAFALIAGAGAGLVAIGGLARLALARTLIAAARDKD